MTTEWRPRHVWRLRDANVSFRRAADGEGWMCAVAYGARGRLLEAGIPYSGAWIGPFSSLSLAGESVAGALGVSPRMQQDRVYADDRIPLHIWSHPDGGARTYRVLPADDYHFGETDSVRSPEDHVPETNLVRALAFESRRARAHRHWGIVGDTHEYATFSEARRAAEEWWSQERLDLPDAALLRSEVRRAAIERGRRTMRAIRRRARRGDRSAVVPEERSPVPDA